MNIDSREKNTNEVVGTYISLFSSAGIGCFGFKMEGFECIATNEILTRRMNVQKINKKCKYESGYIEGDIRDQRTKLAIWNEIDYWRNHESVNRVDVVIATPPCQGMSVANHKKTSNEIVRNSLVVESIKIVREINPKFFVFENVPSFMKTLCTDTDGLDKPIGDAIYGNLGKHYSIVSNVINFMNHGASSSRQRTLVIGVARDFADEVSPYELFPSVREVKTLREAIGELPSLHTMGEFDPDDIYHFFRPYPVHMREWISDLNEGQSAFDNSDPRKIPHKVMDDQRVFNVQKNGDKYKRQVWDKVGPCIHTRNDQLASQNTVHPKDDRVFSIREIMIMMTIPQEFKWAESDLNVLNRLSTVEKTEFMKRNEFLIRQSIGEAVPTAIFQEIAHRMKLCLQAKTMNTRLMVNLLDEYDFTDVDTLLGFIDKNPLNLSISSLARIAEYANTKRTDHAAYFTSKSLITEMLTSLPNFDSKHMRILEPSVGVGNFVPLILKKFQDKIIDLYLIDIDPNSLIVLKKLLEKIDIPSSCSIHMIEADFLDYQSDIPFDLVIGNPPFYKIKSDESIKLKKYRSNVLNAHTRNICSFFLEKSINISKYVALVFPKSLLNTPEFSSSRDYLSNLAFDAIIDFGEEGFPGVLIETIAVVIHTSKKPKFTTIKSHCLNQVEVKRQDYIFDKSLPYWIIYRNDYFDNVLKKLELGFFSVFRDRQITNNILDNHGDIRVLRSRNITNDGKNILNIPGYDAYMDESDAKDLAVYKFIDSKEVYLTPNMTYYPRVIKKPRGCLVNGSIAILIPRTMNTISQKQLDYFATDEYRQFYKIARNFQTRSLNIDSCSVFFFGLLKVENDNDLV